MSLPHPPGDPMAPPVPRTVPMPATPGSPLEPLRSGRRLDRRHWLLAGLLGIVGGGLLLDGVLGLSAGLATTQPQLVALAYPIGSCALGLAATVVAYASAPGGGVRRMLGIVVLVIGVLLAGAYAYALFAGPIQVPVGVRWVVSPQSLVLGVGVVGWLLASGARWWAFLVVVLAPLVAAVPTLLITQGVEGATLLPTVVAFVLALLALALSIPRRR